MLFLLFLIASLRFYGTCNLSGSSLRSVFLLFLPQAVSVSALSIARLHFCSTFWLCVFVFLYQHRFGCAFLLRAVSIFIILIARPHFRCAFWQSVSCGSLQVGYVVLFVTSRMCVLLF